MTVFLVRRDGRVPSHDGALVAHAWCSTTLPQPEGYPPGMQLFCEEATFWSPRLRGPGKTAARVKAVLQLRRMIEATAAYARRDGHVFAFPEHVVLVDVDGVREIPWADVRRMIDAGGG